MLLQTQEEMNHNLITEIIFFLSVQANAGKVETYKPTYLGLAFMLLIMLVIRLFAMKFWA
jgi:hypothetical protein